MRSTSLKLPRAVHQQIQERVVLDGLGLRGKNAWLINAVESFLQLPDYVGFVDVTEALEGNDINLSLRLPDALSKNLDDAVGVVRSSFPLMEGVKSKILRASIVQQLFKTQML